ncbi:MAG: hypothetical protein H7257_00870 [Taibaiella sp.]|nr:hypothetical protein [Taibaiella sp.]
MLTQSSLKYIFILLFSFLLTGAVDATAQQDTVVAADTVAIADSAVRKPELTTHQLVVGFDIAGPLRNALDASRYGYEIAADYYLHKELYLAAEAGWGGCKAAYTDLKYTTTNAFLRLGFNKVLIARENSKDWGGLLLGLRLGAASVGRSVADYMVTDSLWGGSAGTLPAKNLGAYWVEVTAGVRVELYKGLLAGWNVRGKFLLNTKQLEELAPLNISGYGRGDKNSVFDINFYLSYAIRWGR